MVKQSLLFRNIANVRNTLDQRDLGSVPRNIILSNIQNALIQIDIRLQEGAPSDAKDELPNILDVARDVIYNKIPLKQGLRYVDKYPLK